MTKLRNSKYAGLVKVISDWKTENGSCRKVLKRAQQRLLKNHSHKTHCPMSFKVNSVTEHVYKQV